MAIDAWLPVGYKFPDGGKVRIALFEGTNWQILETQCSGRSLVVHDELARRWMDAGLIELGRLSSFRFGSQALWVISCDSSQSLCPVNDGRSPDSKVEALSFALTLRATRKIDPDSPLQDALYIEKISRLLPTYSISSRTDDDVILGFWLTGGASISAKSFRRLAQAMSWLGTENLKEVIEAAGFDVEELVFMGEGSTLSENHSAVLDECDDQKVRNVKSFELAGRAELAAFFNEHIVDIVLNRDRYKALGIDFPSAVILHGPPGTGKTFAVERLTDFLGWPSFQVDASSVASPYIHETSKKVAEIFEKAIGNAPSVLIIDEMEAFLADREMGSGHHRVEEVAEFLRRIPEATKCGVLVIGMTNRIDIIDSAIQRRGRFDHVIMVDYASELEVLSLLDKLLSSLPKDVDVDSKPLASELAGRPLSDVAFVVREGARLAARSGKAKLCQANLIAAMSAVPARVRDGGVQRRIGFI